MKPLIIFVDTEFTGIKPNLNDSQLISIGFVDETGSKTFYAELIEGYIQDQCCPFVIDEIIPLLDAPELPSELDFTAIYARMTAEQLSVHLAAWLNQFDRPIELRSDYPEFERHFVNRLFAGYQWPENLHPEVSHCMPMASPMELLRYYQRAEVICDAQKFRQHHALDDAKVMRLAMIGEEL
jgi:hypothetical protein